MEIILTSLILDNNRKEEMTEEITIINDSTKGTKRVGMVLREIKEMTLEI